MNLIFIADPMCSWCYGFGKELGTLAQAHPDLPLQIVVGGVRAGDTAVMTEEMKLFRLSHWARVERASGLSFNREAFVALQGFVYDTEPACRAVVSARRMAPGVDLLSVFRRIQEAFYVHGQDCTRGEVLAEVAARAMGQVGFNSDPASFLAVWQDAETIAETRADFAKARNWGVSSFPQPLLEVNGQLHSVAPGYTSVAELEKSLGMVLERVGYRSRAEA